MSVQYYIYLKDDDWLSTLSCCV